MYELQKNGKVFTSKFVGTGPSSCKKRIYRAAVSQRLRNTAVNSNSRYSNCHCSPLKKSPIIRIFCISGLLTVPINPDKWSSTVLSKCLPENIERNH